MIWAAWIWMLVKINKICKLASCYWGSWVEGYKFCIWKWSKIVVKVPGRIQNITASCHTFFFYTCKICMGRLFFHSPVKTPKSVDLSMADNLATENTRTKIHKTEISRRHPENQHFAEIYWVTQTSQNKRSSTAILTRADVQKLKFPRIHIESRKRQATRYLAQLY